MVEDWSGFWGLTEDIVITPSQKLLLPAALDSFESARYFARGIFTLEPNNYNLQAANWNMNAHLAAVISIDDLANNDFKRIGKSAKYKNSTIGKEFFLLSNDSIALERDPLAINRVYRILRNLAVHYGTPIIEYRNPILEMDNEKAPNRWFFCQIDKNLVNQSLSHRKSKKAPLITDVEIDKFNEYAEKKTLTNIIGQHLYVLFRALKETIVNLATTK